MGVALIPIDDDDGGGDTYGGAPALLINFLQLSLKEVELLQLSFQ